jgi:hypothetical protein
MVYVFPQFSLILLAYNSMYVIQPGANEKVEANPDAIGLKLGIIFDTAREKQELLFYKFIVHNECEITITHVDLQDIDYYGGKTKKLFLSDISRRIIFINIYRGS